MSSTKIKHNISYYESIALYAFLASITGVSLDILLPAYQAISQSFGLSKVTYLQQNILLFVMGMFLGELSSGYLCDRHGRKKILLVSISIYLVGTWVCLLPANFSLLMLGRVIEGVGAAGQKISVRAVLRDRFSGAQLAKVSSFILIALVFTPFIAPFIGAQITKQFGWRYIFGFLTAFGLIGLSWLLIRHAETLKPQNRNTEGIKGFIKILSVFIRHPTCMSYTLVAGLLFGIQLAFISLSPLLLKDLYGIDQNFSFYFGTMTLGFGMALFLNGKLVHTYGMQNLTNLGLLLFLSMGVFLAILAFAGGTPKFSLFFPLIFGLLFSLGIVFGNIIALTLEPLGKAAGLGSAFSSSFSTVIALCVSFAIGYFCDMEHSCHLRPAF